MALVSRDPFARTELHRSVVTAHTGITCSNCGGVRISPKGWKSLYEYRTESDGGRSSTHRGLFCCKSCHDSYHG